MEDWDMKLLSLTLLFMLATKYMLIKNARLKVCWAVIKLVNEQVYSNFIIAVWCDMFSIDWYLLIN